MPEYTIRLVDPTGRIAARAVSAADAHAAVSAAGVSAAHVLSIELTGGATTSPLEAVPSQTRALPLRLFSQELGVLLVAGIPLLEALTTLLEKESSQRAASALRAVVTQVQGGSSFSAALSTRPDVFDSLFIAVIESSERTGQLAHALREHAIYLRWRDDLRAKLVGASIYPVTLVLAGTAVIVFLLLFVVPRFAGILDGLGGEMPAASRLLIELGRATGDHPWITIAVGTLLLAAPVMLWRQERVRSAIMARVWHLPLLGPKLHLLALAQFYRTGSMLLAAGVPLVSALQTSRAVIAAHLRPSLDLAIDSVRDGNRLSAALEHEGLTTPVSLRMVRVGERTGELAQMLGQAAAFYDEELSRLSDLVTRLVNPVLMLVMGLVIGTIIVLMYLPIFQLVEQVQ